MDQLESKSSTRGWIVAIVVVLCCICLIVISLAGYAHYYLNNSNVIKSGLPSLPSNSSNNNALPQPTVPVARPPLQSVSNETSNTLSQTTVPYNDLYDLACR